VKYLLWDFDGTLAHRPGQWSGAVLSVLRRAGLDRGIDPDRIRVQALSADEWWAALAPVLVPRSMSDAQPNLPRNCAVITWTRPNGSFLTMSCPP
jgi:phosphoglycolate phosphatase-like HAD superfamily hydrolase